MPRRYLSTFPTRRSSDLGDITLSPQFVYVASYQGGVAARNAIDGQNKKQNLESVPRVTFTTPSVATVGLTEEQAKEKGIDRKSTRLNSSHVAISYAVFCL